MAVLSKPENLEKLWLHARSGTLCAREQMKAWGLREAWKQLNLTTTRPPTRKELYGMLEFVRQRVRTSGQQPTHPTCNSLKALFEKIDADPSWYPGKKDEDATPPGPLPVLRGVKRKAVAEAAMALKRRREEPTYSAIVAQCPNAALNPQTGDAVTPKLIYNVVKQDCYDKDPAAPWRNQPRVAKKGLTDDAICRRFAWGVDMQSKGYTAPWMFKNVVWTDICNSVLARSVTKANEMALARKSGKGWISDDSKYDNQNLRGDKNTLKLSGSDTQRVYWAPILAMGKLHVEILPLGFPGETEAGAAILMQRVRAALNVRFQSTRAPRHVFVDRGNGFYTQVTGEVTPGYRQALHQHGLKNFMGNNCGLQPGQLGDMLLHETAVSWIRNRERRTVPARAWEETYSAFSQRLKSIVTDFNNKYDVDGLCREFPARVDQLVSKEGGKLKK